MPEHQYSVTKKSSQGCFPNKMPFWEKRVSLPKMIALFYGDGEHVGQRRAGKSSVS